MNKNILYHLERIPAYFIFGITFLFFGWNDYPAKPNSLDNQWLDKQLKEDKDAGCFD